MLELVDLPVGILLVRSCRCTEYVCAVLTLQVNIQQQTKVMATLIEGQQYGLTSQVNHCPNQTLIFVKLTDSALRSIEQYINSQVCYVTHNFTVICSLFLLSFSLL